MNLVVDDAVEVKQITKTNSEEKRRQLGTAYPRHYQYHLAFSANELPGQILLKGDNVSLIQEAV